jgi:hypothetical protein
LGRSGIQLYTLYFTADNINIVRAQAPFVTEVDPNFSQVEAPADLEAKGGFLFYVSKRNIFKAGIEDELEGRPDISMENAILKVSPS